MNLILQNYSIIVNQIDLHKFQKGIVDVSQNRNQLYRTVPVGSKNSTGTLDISTKTTFTKLFHSSKSFSRFTKSLKKVVENILGDYIGEVSNPHLSFYYSKIKKNP